jgi:Fe-S cluster assembly protein SufD
VFVNGHYQPDLSLLKNVPSKVVVSLLTDATRTYGAFLNNQWAKGMKEETDPFAAFNGALHQNGAFLYIPPRTVLEVPIQILHLVDSADGTLVMPRIHVSLGIQADAKFVFKTTLLNTTHYGINQVAEFALDEGARADITQVVENEANTGWHLDALRGQLKRDSRLHCVALTKGSLTTRFDYRVGLGGENGEALLQGLWTLSEKREAHIHVLIDHQAPYCRSNQLFKGVLSDFSRSSFEGKIMVRQAAQKTEAFQLNNNLLLSERANADSKPNLEIFADDVKASHGATIGQLDSEQLFYLKTRGLHDQVAKTLLIDGFCKEVTDLVGVPSVLN